MVVVVLDCVRIIVWTVAIDELGVGSDIRVGVAWGSQVVEMANRFVIIDTGSKINRVV